MESTRKPHVRAPRAVLALTVSALALGACAAPEQPQDSPAPSDALSVEQSPILNGYNTNRAQAQLTIEVLGIHPTAMDGYSPAPFAIDQDKLAADADWPPTAAPNEHCSISNATLARDGVGVSVDPNTCEVSGGQWYDPLSGDTVTRDDVEARPFLPTERAWASGGSAWDAHQLSVYRNAPESVLAISDTAYEERGQRGPDQWRPEDQAQWCGYALRWVSEKSTYGLSMENQAEQDALTEMLNTCPDDGFVAQSS